MSRVTFPRDFVWGAATAAYQIEGAHNVDGKGESIWDRFSHTAGKVHRSEHGDVACDHYHRYAEDVASMRTLGLAAYRFSVSWPRIMPEGVGRLNQRGIDFYARLVDCLLEAGIQPWLTLYHWDLPQALQARGGFRERMMADWFADYVAVVARALGDRVKHFMTFNEPQIFSLFGHWVGIHAPGLTGMQTQLDAVHHINLAHGRAVQALRAYAPDAKVGPVHQAPPIHPVTDREADRAAAQRWDVFFNRLFLDPMHKGEYPAEAAALVAPAQLPIRAGDLAIIHQPVDFVGVNNYSRVFVRAAPRGLGVAALPDLTHRVAGAQYTDMDWEVYPDGLYEVLMRFRNEYGDPELYVTENGGAFADVLEQGRVADDEREELLRDYLTAAARALAHGAKLRGYFVWSLLDNFEWTHGYSKRFGLIHVDYATQVRTLKDSARWYARVIAESGF
jgi:beta-glucosidase